MLQRKHLLATASAILLLIILLSGGYVSQNPTTLSSLHPFRKQHRQAPWLLATMSPATGLQRRAVIRATWQTLYHNPEHFDTRFVIANPHELWRPIIEQENATYGDIIILAHLEESHQIANTIKPIEFMKHLLHSGHHYSWVSKVDDDSYIDASTFYREFLLPRLGANNTIIARYLSWAQMRPNDGIDFTCPGGQFYTLSWDMLALLVRLHTANPIDNEGEDGMLGTLLHDAGHEFSFVNLDDQRAFDVHEDMHAYGMQMQDLGGVQDMHKALNPHKMKGDDMYLDVAALFDEGGFRGGRGAGTDDADADAEGEGEGDLSA